MEALQQEALGDNVALDSCGHASGVDSTKLHTADIPATANQKGSDDDAVSSPTKSTGQLMQSDDEPSKRAMAVEGSEKKTAESIARLPPKLRARLLQRGILKEEDVLKCGLPKAGATVKAPSTHNDGVAAAVVPAENPSIGAQTNDLLAAASSLAFVKASPSVRPMIPEFGQGQAQSPFVKAAPLQNSDRACEPPFVKAAPLRNSDRACEPKTVYSSGPVLNEGALKKRAESDVDPKEQADAKKLRASEVIAESPADARAAAARAEATDKAPVWVYKDGTILNSATQDAAAKLAPTAAQSGQIVAQAQTAAEQTAATVQDAPLPPGPPPGPPLPINWVAVPHDGDYYYWNTATDEVSWEHPAGGSEDKQRAKFTEEHRVLWTDLGKIIGRQGLNLKIIKASIGCNINIPRRGGKKGGKGSCAKDGNKGKGKDKAAVRRGIGTGDKLEDDDFANVVFTGDTLHQARGGKRCVEVMIGYGRSVEGALSVLGIEMKLPSLEELAGGAGKKDAPMTKDGIDPMDPAAYSDAPVGVWSAGMKKPGEASQRGQKGKGRGGQKPPPPQDSSTANAERF